MEHQHTPVARSLPMALLRAREAVIGPARRVLTEIGVTEPQWRVLRILHETGPLGFTELSARATLLMPSLTRIAQGLEERGLIARISDPRDRRRQTLKISDDGARLVQDNVHAARRINNAVRDYLGEAEHELLLDLLNKIEKMRS